MKVGDTLVVQLPRYGGPFVFEPFDPNKDYSGNEHALMKGVVTAITEEGFKYKLIDRIKINTYGSKAA